MSTPSVFAPIDAGILLIKGATSGGDSMRVIMPRETRDRSSRISVRLRFHEITPGNRHSPYDTVRPRLLPLVMSTEIMEAEGLPHQISDR